MRYLEVADFAPFTFPGGERHIQVKENKLNFIGKHTEHCPDPIITIRANITSSDNILDLFLALNVLNGWGMPKPKHLILAYVPYARQDRHTADGSPLSIEVFADIINSFQFESVLMYEPHSMVAPALIKNRVVKYCEEAAFNYIQRMSNSSIWDKPIKTPILVSPDLGAVKRVERVYDYCVKFGIYVGNTIAQCTKRRDPATGRVHTDAVPVTVMGRDAIIIDDICDGGATFCELAPKLYENGAKSVHLFVAHGIFSKGLDRLIKAGIRSIGTTDSFLGPTKTTEYINQLLSEMPQGGIPITTLPVFPNE